MGVRGAWEAGLDASVLPERGKQPLDATVGGVLFQEQENVQVRVEPVLPVGDFQGANGALDAQELTELVACAGAGSATPCVADLIQENRQLVAKTVGHGEESAA